MCASARRAVISLAVLLLSDTGINQQAANAAGTALTFEVASIRLQPPPTGGVSWILGLKLESRRAPIPVLVVEHIERPTEN